MDRVTEPKVESGIANQDASARFLSDAHDVSVNQAHSATANAAFDVPGNASSSLSFSPRSDSSVSQGFAVPSSPRYDSSVNQGFAVQTGPRYDAPVNQGFNVPFIPRYDSPVNPGSTVPSNPPYDFPSNPIFNVPSNQPYEGASNPGYSGPANPGYEVPVDPNLPSNPNDFPPVVDEALCTERRAGDLVAMLQDSSADFGRVINKFRETFVQEQYYGGVEGMNRLAQLVSDQSGIPVRVDHFHGNSGHLYAVYLTYGQTYEIPITGR